MRSPRNPTASRPKPRRCAFLTQAGHDASPDDVLAFGPLQERGWRVEAVPWQGDGVDWRRYRTVVIRSTWDYHHRPEAFLAALEDIVRAGASLENPLELVRWNHRKTYLRDLAARGVPIVPTCWRDGLAAGDLRALLDTLGCDEMIVKPQVSASAEEIFRIGRDTARAALGALEARFECRPLLAQPLVPAVLEEGEHSLVYLDGRFSHAVLKAPAAGDFRVQEEHGGTTTPEVADDPLLRAGAAVLNALTPVPLYARVDLVRAAQDDGYWLMELELIEPALYLSSDAHAAHRFAEALEARQSGSA